MNALRQTLDILPSARCGLYMYERWGLVQRTVMSSHNGGRWEWFGGKLDLDEAGLPMETALEAAVRETEEEGRITPRHLMDLGVIESHPILDGKHTGRYSVTMGFLATDYSGTVALDPDECQATGWFTTEEAMRLPLTRETAAGIIQALSLIESHSAVLLQ